MSDVRCPGGNSDEFARDLDAAIEFWASQSQIQSHTMTSSIQRTPEDVEKAIQRGFKSGEKSGESINPSAARSVSKLGRFNSHIFRSIHKPLDKVSMAAIFEHPVS